MPFRPLKHLTFASHMLCNSPDLVSFIIPFCVWASGLLSQILQQLLLHIRDLSWAGTACTSRSEMAWPIQLNINLPIALCSFPFSPISLSAPHLHLVCLLQPSILDWILLFSSYYTQILLLHHPVTTIAIAPWCLPNWHGANNLSVIDLIWYSARLPVNKLVDGS